MIGNDAKISCFERQFSYGRDEAEEEVNHGSFKS